MDIKFYKKLLSFRSHSKSSKQIEFREWLQAYIEVTHPGVITELDHYGNLYVTKIKNEQDYYNCVVAHLDINQKVQTDDFSILVINNLMIGINNITAEQIGLGHDDKIGVYFALQALKKFDNIKCFFPLDEEVGCLGSKASDTSFFDNVGFLVQLDRRGYYDISQFTNGHATVTYETKKEFEKLLCKYNFHWINTVSTDVGELIKANYIQGVNISCGYSNEHTDKEVLHILRYKNSEKFALELLKKTDGKFYYMDITLPSYTQPAKTSYSNSKTTTNKDLGGNKKESNVKNIKIDEPIFSDKEIADTLDSIEFGIDSLLDIEITNLKEINDFKKLAYDLRDCVKNIEDYHTQDSFLCRLYTNVSAVNTEFSLSPYHRIGTLDDLEKDLEDDFKKAQKKYES